MRSSWKVFSHLMINDGGPAHSRQCYPWAGSPGFYRKAGWASHMEQASKLFSFKLLHTSSKRLSATQSYFSFFERQSYRRQSYSLWYPKIELRPMESKFKTDMCMNSLRHFSKWSIQPSKNNPPFFLRDDVQTGISCKSTIKFGRTFHVIGRKGVSVCLQFIKTCLCLDISWYHFPPIACIIIATCPVAVMNVI